MSQTSIRFGPDSADSNKAPTAPKPAKRPALPSNISRYMPVVVLVVLLGVITLIEPAFIPGGGVRVMAVQAVPLILLASGQMLALLVGGIDLSNAALTVFSAILAATLLNQTGILAPILTVLVGAALGALTGGIAGFFQVPTFAVTLGAMGVWQAAALLLSNQSPVDASAHLQPVEWVLNYRFLGVELAVWIAVLIAVVLWFVIRHTVVGQELRAVGMNERASALAGVHRLRARVIVYSASGALSALAGLFLIAQQGVASPIGAGSSLLLPSVAAAIVGGCAVTGGVARPINVVIGALIVTLIPIGASAFGLGPNVQSLIFGLVIVVAVIATIDRKSRAVTK
jgi:ribose transport system permease protein